MRVVAPPS